MVEDKALGKSGPDSFLISGQGMANAIKTPIIPPRLSDLDIWNIQQDGDWFFFDGNLPGTDAARGYRLHKDSATIIAVSQLPLLGVFELGGQSCAMGNEGGADYPYHVFVADDDIGPVGMAGLEIAINTSSISTMRERTAPAIVADTLLQWSEQDARGLPLFYVRTETDSSACVDEFSRGMAIQNINLAIQSWFHTASYINTPPALLCIILDIAGDDISSTRDEYLSGIQAILDELQESLFPDQIDIKPRVVTVFSSGSQRPLRPELITAQWDAIFHFDPKSYLIATPGYALHRTKYGWLSDQGRLHKAEMIAAALTYIPSTSPEVTEGSKDTEWHCPVVLLAEWSDDHIKVVFRSLTPLVLDDLNPFDANAHFGFQIESSTDSLQIKAVEIDPKDPKALIIRCDEKPEAGAILNYAAGADEQPGRDYAVNCGAVRDTWQMISKDQSSLHRWALPCHLPIGGL